MVMGMDGKLTCTIDVHALGADPALFGLALADLARHGARAWSQALVGVDEAHTLERILELFESEMASPTAATQQLPDGGLQ